MRKTCATKTKVYLFDKKLISLLPVYHFILNQAIDRERTLTRNLHTVKHQKIVKRSFDKLNKLKKRRILKIKNCVF